MIITMLSIFSLVFAAHKDTPRVLENHLVQVSINRVERPVAEPSSKPYEIALTILCKNKKSTKTVSFPVCDFELQDKDSNVSPSDIAIAYFPWDGVKSNNLQGRIFCDSKNKLFYRLKIAEVCK